MENTRVKPWN